VCRGVVLERKLTRLFQKKSKTGATYFTGRLGSAKIVLLKSKDQADGDPIWNLTLSEAPQKAEERSPAADWQSPHRPASLCRARP
jgi:hypothetical protein